MSTVLVLGAGGLTGSAFHAGVLQGLLDRGWDAAVADLVVGTSAGSSTGASLRAGIPVTDLWATQTGGRVSESTRARRHGLPPELDWSAPPSMRKAVTNTSPACCSMAQNVPHRERSGNFISPGLRISRPFDISCLTSKEKTAKNGPQLNSPFIPI